MSTRMKTTSSMTTILVDLDDDEDEEPEDVP